MALEILERRRFKDDYVPIPITSGRPATLTPYLKGRNPRDKPLIDLWSGDNFNQRNSVITPTALHAEVHRGVHRTSPWKIVRHPRHAGRSNDFADGTVAQVCAGGNDFCHTREGIMSR